MEPQAEIEDATEPTHTISRTKDTRNEDRYDFGKRGWTV